MGLVHKELGYLAFFHFILQLKSLKRKGWVVNAKIPDAESVADHSYSMCAISMILSDILNLDTERVMRMVILHDLAESKIGDFTPEEISKEEKRMEEKNAMNCILSSLPSENRIIYEEIWKEYLDNNTDLARFVHEMDKFEMALQARQYLMQGTSEKLLAPFFESAIKYLKGNKHVIFMEILKALKSNALKH